jgi:uncharacterized protein (TIGR02246 family)
MLLAMEPEHIHTLFRDRFRARDIEGILELYEDDNTFLTAPDAVVTGKAALREALLGFLAIEGSFDLETRYVARCNDIALLSNAWHLVGKAPDGSSVDLRGQTAEVVRRQQDGRWLYIIDHPFGGQ